MSPLKSMVISPTVDAEGRVHALVVTFRDAPGFEWRLTGDAAEELRDYLVALRGLPEPAAKRDGPVSGLPPRPPPTSLPGPGELRGSGPTWADHLLFDVAIVGMMLGVVVALAIAVLR